MELIFLSGRLFYWMVIAPIWWLATLLATPFYPVEGSTGNTVMALLLSFLIGVGVVFGLYYYL